MKVQIKRLENDLPLPIYETDGSVGFDIMARTDVVIDPRSLAFIPSNLIVETPKNYMLVVAARSSAPKKKGLMTPHGIGIIDHDYCGPEDEIKIQVYNFTDKPVEIKRGEKIAQGIFVKIGKAKWKEVAEVKGKTRGGFGSTGGYKT